MKSEKGKVKSQEKTKDATFTKALDTSKKEREGKEINTGAKKTEASKKAKTTTKKIAKGGKKS